MNAILRRSELHNNPFVQFEAWFHEAQQCQQINLPETMCLSTLEDGFPNARMVLLKGFDPNGFVFYTNALSPKGQGLLKNPKAALTFYWEPLKKQIRIQGTTQQVSDQEADTYFHTRPRLSQLSAWASHQSQVLESREILEQRFREVAQQYQEQEVPRPPHWTGFCVKPLRFEFWQEGPNRLHDRFAYISDGDQWFIQRLYP